MRQPVRCIIPQPTVLLAGLQAGSESGAAAGAGVGVTVIGLGATEQVGKDTVGSRLVDRYGFTRFAFADAIRAVLERVDPQVGPLFTLGELLASGRSWDELKRSPDVRRMLVGLSVGMRELVAADVWVRPVQAAVAGVVADGGRVVVTDVRWWNEFDGLRAVDPGAVMVEVLRPGSPPRSAAEQLVGDWCDVRLVNDGSIADLFVRVDELMDRLGIDPVGG